MVELLAPVTDPSLLNESRYFHGDAPIMAAVKSGDPELVEAFLKADISLELGDRFGNTPLMYAARAGYTRIVTKLIRKGADVNARDPNGVTALTKAIVGNRIAVIQVLRQNGATR